MNSKYEKLKNLLKELFQLDQPDLDFGLYRIMHAKSAEITKFLDKDLLPQVKEAFSEYRSSDKAELEQELARLVAGIEAAGMDPAQSPKVKELHERLNSKAVDTAALETEVYDDLYTFFRRYYAEGDFLAKRVYKRGVYAIPYGGEEVVLHWANKDQYYIKTTEYLRDYAFRLRPDDQTNPMRVHFRLSDVAEGEHGNVKPAEGKDRLFVLAAAGESGHDFLAEEQTDDGKELIIRFEYRPATLNDWPETVRGGKTKPPAQKDLIPLAGEQILGVSDPSFAVWLRELAHKHVLNGGETSEYTRLEVHLKRYTARNTFDYFIHKDLGRFLRLELDFFIKNELLHLDDIAQDTGARVEQYLSKVRVTRKIAEKIIDFLAQLEDFQKRLWLKKKFVVSTHYCIALGCIPEQFYPEIASNNAQREDWIKLFAIDKLESSLIANYSQPLSVEFLKSLPALVVDTRYFPEEFTARLLERFEGLDELTDGLLVHSENFQALSLLDKVFRERVKCVYIDPPYNSKTSEIAYKNSYKHSSWITLMDNRLDLSRRLMTEAGTHVVAIDENEQEVLGLLLGMHFPFWERICVAVVHNKKGIQGDYFSYNHDYAYFCVSPGLAETRGTPVPDAEWEYMNLRKWGRESERSTAKNCFYPIYVQDGVITGFGDVAADDFHPGKANITEDGRVLVYPIDSSGIERKWRYARASIGGILPLLKCYVTKSGEIQIMKAVAERPLKTVWENTKYIAGDYGTKWLTDLGVKVSDDVYPKSVHTVEDSVFAVTDEHSIVLDYFGGTGTTGHAVINLNRQGGRRKFILVEMSHYFDTILLPRIKKVAFTPDWKNGKPRRRATRAEVERGPRIIKVIRLESYEDSLNNLQTQRTPSQQLLLDSPETQGPNGMKEDYLLRYALNIETQDSQSLLNASAFADPTGYKLKVKVIGSDESRDAHVDLIETFNWLIGLSVHHMAAPQSFDAEVERDSEGRLRIRGSLKQNNAGPYWFRTVAGTTHNGSRTLVIWRKLTGNPEADNVVLNEWFTMQDYSTTGREFETIYVNGTNNLEDLKRPSDSWRVRSIEEHFYRNMFGGDVV